VCWLVPIFRTYGSLLQNNIGADIIMALDDVVKTTITCPRIEESMYRTLRWIDRCISGMIIYLAEQITDLYGTLLCSGSVRAVACPRVPCSTSLVIDKLDFISFDLLVLYMLSF
jgi:hypothetical protein